MSTNRHQSEQDDGMAEPFTLLTGTIRPGSGWNGPPARQSSAPRANKMASDRRAFGSAAGCHRERPGWPFHPDPLHESALNPFVALASLARNPNFEFRSPNDIRSAKPEKVAFGRMSAQHFFQRTDKAGFGLRISGFFRVSGIRPSDFKFSGPINSSFHDSCPFVSIRG